MEGEFDLRSYIYSLIPYWPWILFISLGLGAVMLVQSWRAPTRYQATAMVAITRPIYQFQFSDDIRNQTEPSGAQGFTGKVVLDIATSDALLQQVLDEVDGTPPSARGSIAALRLRVNARLGSDPSILILTAVDQNAERAAKLVNSWAELYIQQINRLYSVSADQLTFFDGQLVQAKNEMEQADQSLIDWQKDSDRAILEAQLAAKQGALANYLSLNESLGLLLQNVKDLQKQLERLPADTPSTLGDDLTTLALQARAFNAQLSIPLQVQLSNSGRMSNKTVAQQAAYLADLGDTIENQRAEAKKEAEALPEAIKTLQGRIQEAKTEEARLTRQRDLASSLYTILARKVTETRLTTQDTSTRARLVSRAATPERPLNKKRLTNGALGLAAGLIVGVVGASIVEYFRAPIRPRPESGRETAVG